MVFPAYGGPDKTNFTRPLIPSVSFVNCWLIVSLGLLVENCNACTRGVIVSSGRLLLLEDAVANRKSGAVRRDGPARAVLFPYTPVYSNSAAADRSQVGCGRVAGVCVGSGRNSDGIAAARAEPKIERFGPPSLPSGSPGFSPWRMIHTKLGNCVLMVVILSFRDRKSTRL